MQIICISRGTLAGGKTLANNLAKRLGYSCLSRERLAEAAISEGIDFERLENSISRKRPFNESDFIEKELYKAFVTKTLCDKTLSGGLVYHGQTGHMQLPGVNNVLKVRVILNPETRLELTMKRLNLSHKQAQEHIENLDDKRLRWVQTLYNVDWRDPNHYDLVLNLSRFSLDDAAVTIEATARLNEFLPTSTSQTALSELSLAATCRLAIGKKPATHSLDVKVKAQLGQVTVTYLPRDEIKVPLIKEALKPAKLTNLVCTMASNNLMWIQENFDQPDDILSKIIEIATRWDSAVELAKVSSSNSDDLEGERAESKVNLTHRTLINVGRSGGYRTLYGNGKEILKAFDHSIPYSLIVVGSVYLSESLEIRKRRTRELINFLAENLKVPVIGREDLEEQYSFKKTHWISLGTYGLISALTFYTVFSNQSVVLEFFSRTGTWHRLMAAVTIFVLVPLFAYCYGAFARLTLRMLKFE